MRVKGKGQEHNLFDLVSFNSLQMPFNQPNITEDHQHSTGHSMSNLQAATESKTRKFVKTQ